MGRHDYTGLLYAQPSFSAGIARTLDVGGTFDDYNYSSSPAEADQIALTADWYAIGADLFHVLSRFAAKTAGRIPHGRRSVRG
jgi:hypothetical protein